MSGSVVAIQLFVAKIDVLAKTAVGDVSIRVIDHLAQRVRHLRVSRRQQRVHGCIARISLVGSAASPGVPVRPLSRPSCG
jgi:hypothetical protein